MRILVVDDDVQVREILSAKLQRCGHDVSEAANGKEAIKALQQDRYEIVITDILMPEQDGLDAILFVRKNQPQTKIIAITGARHPVHLDNARGLGASRVFAKPFELDDIAQAVRELAPH